MDRRAFLGIDAFKAASFKISPDQQIPEELTIRVTRRDINNIGLRLLTSTPLLAACSSSQDRKPSAPPQIVKPEVPNEQYTTKELQRFASELNNWTINAGTRNQVRMRDRFENVKQAAERSLIQT